MTVIMKKVDLSSERGAFENLLHLLGNHHGKHKNFLHHIPSMCSHASQSITSADDHWLPINDRRELNLLKSCFKALPNTETWPDYLKIIKQECPKELRSSNSIELGVPTENGTFQDNASKLFNNLPETIRNCKDYRTFLRLSRNFLSNRVQSD